MQQPPIISNPNSMMGKPIIAGTRITVEHILEAHPHITREQVLAAITYAAESVRIDHTYPLKQAS